MTTITVWLLIAVGGTNAATSLIERFPTEVDCEQVRAKAHGVLRPAYCIKANVVKP